MAMANEQNSTESFEGLVLLFSRRDTADNAARLHAATCSVVIAARARKHVSVVDDRSDLAGEVEDLRARGWKVSRCPCTNKIPPTP